MDRPLPKSPRHIFDRQRIQRNKDRAAKKFDQHDFLHRHTARQLRQRLLEIKKDTPSVLELGSSFAVICPSTISEKKVKHAVYSHLSNEMLQLLKTPECAKKRLMDEENLSWSDKPLDLVVSNLALHTVNDLPKALSTLCNTILKPDGLLVISLFGGETLFALKQSMMEAESEIYGGVAARIAPKIDMKTMGGLIQRCGFNLPTIDFETVNVSYDNIYGLMHDLRGMGENRVHNSSAPYNVSRRYFEKVDNLYRKNFGDDNGKLQATFDIIYAVAWAPDPSQPKPLKRGSGKISLEKVLEGQ